MLPAGKCVLTGVHYPKRRKTNMYRQRQSMFV